MRIYTEEQVVEILDYIERNGFNYDCMTINDELEYLNSIGIVKNCSIPNITQQSELLKAFIEWRLKNPYSDFQTQDYDIAQFLKAFNCA